MDKSSKKILAISSGGGHWVELLRLQPAFTGHRVTYATVNRSYASDVEGSPFETFPDATRWNRLKLCWAACHIFWILIRVRPDIVMTTGAAPGYLALLMARWFGARTVWLDSIANVDELSLAGQKAGKIADLWLTQWPHLARETGPLYCGSILQTFSEERT